MKIHFSKIFAACLAIGLAIFALRGPGAVPPPLYVGVFVGDGSGLTNLMVTNGSGVTFNFITNNVLITTNVTINDSITVQSNIIVKGKATFNTTIVTNLFATNFFATFSTNVFNYATNLYTTNLTIVQPGGATNLNLIPNSLMYSDPNDGEASLPNGPGILTNNGVGGIGWTLSITFTEIDALNAYFTNLFTFITNAPVLATDGNGKVINGVPLAGTNTLFTAGANIVFTTNASGNITIAASGVLSSQVYASNVISGGVLVTNVLSATAGANGWILGQSNAAPVWTQNGGLITNLNGANLQAGTVVNSALANSFITVQGANVALGGATLAAGSSPFFNAVNFTNWNGSMPTNNGGGSALVFGGPSATATASILYSTNITAATTLALFDITHTPNTASGIKLRASCSGGTDRILTFPNGCTGAGLGTPPAVTITNSKAAWFDIIYDPMTPSTNVFWSPVF